VQDLSGQDSSSQSPYSTETDGTEAINIVSLHDLEQGFFYPLRTLDELEVIANDFYYITYAPPDYSPLPVILDSRIRKIEDILFIGGYLYIADSQSLGVHVLDSNFNLIDTINQIPEHRILQPYALAACEEGKLYVALNQHSENGRIGYHIAIFDHELSFEKVIRFTLPFPLNDDVTIFPGSLAVNPAGGFAFTLSWTPNADVAVIYFIDDDGTVTIGPGNVSLGHLLTHDNSLYFVNGAWNIGKGGYDIGISALFQMINGEVENREILPPISYIPFDEELLKEAEAVYIEFNGQQPPDEWYTDVRSASMQYAVRGFISILHLKENIAVICYSGVMHVFNPGLNYLYSRVLRDYDYIQNSTQNYRKSLSGDINTKHTYNLTACTDDEGNIYIAQRILYRHIGGADEELGIVKVNLANLP